MLMLSDLIDAAAEAAGSKSALAREMNTRPQRINEWARGAEKPDAHEIAFLARKAALPILETVAEIEAQLDSRYSEIWREALGKLKAAGIAASVATIALINPTPADAMHRHATKISEQSVYYVNQCISGLMCGSRDS